MKNLPDKELLKIGELARLTKVSTRTIRFYVEEGLLPKPVKTHRNMAYYHPDCIEKVKAIKRAQSERFLPLVVIGRLLEESGHDFASLESKGGPKSMLDHASVNVNIINTPGWLLEELVRRHWISSKNPAKLSRFEKHYLDFFQCYHRLGLSHKAQVRAFESIEKLMQKAVETEFQAFFSVAANTPTDGFESFVETEKQIVQDFLERVRDRSLKNILTRYNRTLDNAVLAVGDEGYGIPLNEVRENLTELEGRLERRSPDIKVLIDLATGYSCSGDQEKAMSFLKRATRWDPDNISAKVRWCWYHRFSQGAGRQGRWRERLAHLVEANPGDIAGHVFLSIWYAFGSTEAADNFEGLRLINLSLKELRAGEELTPPELHDWVLVHYAKGLIYTYVLAGLGERGQGILSFEEILGRRSEIDRYYAGRMPFFPKWLWPNLLYFHGLAKLETERYSEAAGSFREALRFRVSPLFRKRVASGLKAAEEALEDHSRKAEASASAR